MHLIFDKFLFPTFSLYYRNNKLKKAFKINAKIEDVGLNED